ncbi:hypothetical protein [Ruminobacter sp.]|uniref:hypothetical protein n=1 Tax=Ruminobacter sp. TaxID=2774296 RepID=UPI003868E2F5
MGLYEHWPYANFHELNLDWIVKEIAVVREEYQEVQKLAIDLEDLKSKYTEVYALFGELENDFVEFKNDVSNEFNDLQNEYDHRFTQQSQQINNQFTTLENHVNSILSGFSAQLIAMDIKLDNALHNLAQTLTMYNPFTGIEEPMANVIYQLASFHMQDALTAGTYDGFALTAGTYDAKNLTAYQYDVQGSIYLP